MKHPTIGIEIELPWRHVLARVDTEAAELLAASDGFFLRLRVAKNSVCKLDLMR